MTLRDHRQLSGEQTLQADVVIVGTGPGGAAIGRVLAGIQVSPGDGEAFVHYLKDLGYPWAEETGNPAYQLFLR